MSPRLFTPRFFLLWSYSFTVFLSAFQLLPTAPFHIMSLGGSTTEAGLFLGFLTYASAISAPITGAIADRIGKRRVLIIASLAITVFSLLYAVAPSYQVILALVLVHGVFWSGLLSSSSSYVIDILPKSRRAEGRVLRICQHLGVAVAPWIGLWLFDHGGWRLLCLEAAGLNLLMAFLAWRLPPDTLHRRQVVPSVGSGRMARAARRRHVVSLLVQLRRHHQLRRGLRRIGRRMPRALYFTVFCLTIVATRPFIGRYADRAGHARIIVPCLVMIVLGVWVLALADSRPMFVVSAMLFGVGLRLGLSAVRRAPDASCGRAPARRDVRRVNRRVRYRHRHRLDRGRVDQRPLRLWRAFGVAGAIALLSIPYFLYMEKRQWTTSVSAVGAEGLAALPRHHDLRHAGVAAVGPRRSDEPAFIKRAIEHGINFFDTADMYSRGVSEQVVGRR